MEVSFFQNSQSAAGSSEAMEDTDSTEVKYSTRSGNSHCQVLRCSMFAVESSGLNWMIKLLDSYEVLQEGILCDVFSQKCSAAWQSARGERLTVDVMLPGRQDG